MIYIKHYTIHYSTVYIFRCGRKLIVQRWKMTKKYKKNVKEKKRDFGAVGLKENYDSYWYKCILSFSQRRQTQIYMCSILYYMEENQWIWNNNKLTKLTYWLCVKYEIMDIGFCSHLFLLQTSFRTILGEAATGKLYEYAEVNSGIQIERNDIYPAFPLRSTYGCIIWLRIFLLKLSSDSPHATRKMMSNWACSVWCCKSILSINMCCSCGYCTLVAFIWWVVSAITILSSLANDVRYMQQHQRPSHSTWRWFFDWSSFDSFEEKRKAEIIIWFLSLHLSLSLSLAFCFMPIVFLPI